MVLELKLKMPEIFLLPEPRNGELRTKKINFFFADFCFVAMCYSVCARKTLI